MQIALFFISFLKNTSKLVKKVYEPTAIKDS